MLQHYPERVVGTFEGELPGPLIIVIAALHGNEPAGVQALEMVFEALEHERRDNPDFQFHGKLIGLIGNTQAYLLRQRYMEQDINRMWNAELLEDIKSSEQEKMCIRDSRKAERHRAGTRRFF